MPNLKLTLSGGKRYETNGVKWGVLSGWTYRVQDTIIERTTRTYETGVTDLQLRNRADVLQSQQRVSLAGLVSLGAQLNKNNSVQAITLITRISDKTANVVEFFFQHHRLPLLQLLHAAARLGGTHAAFPAIHRQPPAFQRSRLEAELALRVLHRRSRATRSPHRGLRPRPRRHRVPVARRIRRQRTLFLRPFRSGPPPRRRHPQQRFGARRNGHQVQHRLELFFKDRLVDSRRFNFAPPAFTDDWSGFDTLVYQDPETVFASENISPDRFAFIETSKDTDSYKAFQHLGAAYVANDWRFHPAWTLTSGLRFESSYQNVQAFKPGVPDNIKSEADLFRNDILPSALLSWRFTESMQLRLAGSSSVSRPNFRELSDAGFFDVERGRLIKGNSELESSQIHHADLRWEWYFSPKESLSLAAFGKYFNKPIEMVYKVSAENAITYQNANYAENAGVEIEARKSFDFIHKALQPLMISGNASWIYSRVYLEEGTSLSSSTERPLQGQSPWVINGRLAWSQKERSISTLYNVFGPRIVEVGDNGVPDLYEQPFHRWDAVYRENLGDFGLTFKAQNLLDSAQTVTIGDKIVSDLSPGRRFTVDLSYTF